MIPTWSTFATVAADIVPAGGSESLASQRVHADMTHLITTRYRSDVTPKTRGLGITGPYEDVVFDFLNVSPQDGRTRALEITALQRDA